MTTKRRLFGIDRSGPPPEQTRSDAPWNPWTIPNALGFVRALLIPVFLVVALGDDDGIGAGPAILFGIIGFGDYVDGFLARLTGQYSRLGALMDPIVDRALVVAGVIVVWHHDLQPEWALVLLLAREVFLLLAGQAALRRGAEIRINWAGRIGVAPTMGGIWFPLLGLEIVGRVMLYCGLALGWLAAWLYVRDTRAQLASRPATPST